MVRQYINAHSSRAFTLIEVSVVLVILGLLIGGVLVGQSLIRAAELRSVMTDIDTFKTAAANFIEKYDCIPGDCKTATTYFGTQTAGGGCPWTTTANTGTDQSTCNGNGDGLIWDWPAAFDYSYAYEKNRFWQQLSAAGMIQGVYAGIGDQSDSRLIFWASGKRNWNIPASKFLGAAYVVEDTSSLSWHGSYFQQTIRKSNKFIVGEDTNCNYTAPCVYVNQASINHAGAVFTPIEALSIDEKYDDGKPSKGSITAPHRTDWYFGLFCSTVDSDTTAEYYVDDVSASITRNTKRCPLFIDAGF